MKLRDSGLWALLLVVIGIVLIVMHADVKARGLVVTAGIVFLLTGVIALVIWRRALWMQRQRADAPAPSAIGTALGWITISGGVLLGVAMLIFTSTFEGAVPYCLGLLLALASLSQMYTLLIGVRPLRLPLWLWAFPVLIGAAAVWDFALTAGEQDSVLMIVTGAGVALFGVALTVERLFQSRSLVKSEG